MITKEQFCKTIKWLENFEARCEGVDKALSALSDCFCSGFFIPDVSDTIVELLSASLNDDTDMLGYCIFELDFLKHYTDGCVTEEDGTSIDLSTWEKVYDYLVDNLHNDKPINDDENAFVKCVAYHKYHSNNVGHCTATEDCYECDCNGNALDCTFYSKGVIS